MINEINRIAFFGASVTQQKEGYTYEFMKLVTNDISCNVFGYGSMHIYDAGLCFIKDVIETKPHYCFIDWFSTGYKNSYIKKYLDAIVYQLNSIECIPVFLLLDRIDMDNERLVMYGTIREYASLHDISIIEMYNNMNRNEMLRDAVHTNEMGAKFYANTIYKHFIDAIYGKKINRNLDIIPNNFCNIKCLEFDKTIYSKLILCGQAQLIGIYQVVGPHIPLLKINDTIVNIWDMWCYFERKCIKINGQVDGQMTIEICHDNYERETNPNQIIPRAKKCLKILKIFYIGEMEIKEFI
jgi:hypothetical protein